MTNVPHSIHGYKVKWDLGLSAAPANDSRITRMQQWKICERFAYSGTANDLPRGTHRIRAVRPIHTPSNAVRHVKLLIKMYKAK